MTILNKRSLSTPTVLEQYALYLKGLPLLTLDQDKVLWAQFLKDKYGIPKTEEDTEEDGSETQLQKGRRMGVIA